MSSSAPETSVPETETTPTVVTSDLPSGDPVPAPPVPSSSSAAVVSPPADSKQPSNPNTANTPIPATAAAALTSHLSTLPSKTDAFLAHLQRCLAHPSGIDTLFLFLCYTSRLSANLLETLSGPAIQRSASTLLNLASSLPPSAVLVFSTSSAKSLLPGFARLALDLAGRLRALSALTSEARTFLRLWGLVGMYFWGRGLVLRRRAAKAKAAEEGSKESGLSTLDNTIAWSQLISCVVFQALENGVFLSAKGVLKLTPQQRGKAAVWSVRAWGAYVGIELGRLVYEARQRSKKGLVAAVRGEGEDEEERNWADSWRKTLARNLAWFPLTIHWSLEQGLVNDMAVGAFASVPAVIQMRDLWKSTAA